MVLHFFFRDWSFEAEWKIKHWKFIPLNILKIDETLSTLNDVLNTWNCECGSYEVKQQSYFWFISSRRLYIKTAGKAFIWSRMNLLPSKQEKNSKNESPFKICNLPAGESTPLLLLILNETLSFVHSTRYFLASDGFIALQPEFLANTSLSQKDEISGLRLLKV